MAELTSMQAAVLQVLSWQTPGYLCSSYASAFVSQGIEDPTSIEEALIELQELGYTEFFTLEESVDIIQVEKDSLGNPVINPETGSVIPLKDENNEIRTETITQTVDAGWIITEEGRTEVKDA